MRTVFFPKQAEEDMEALCLATKAQMLKVVNEANWMMKCRPRKDVRAFFTPVTHNSQLGERQLFLFRGGGGPMTTNDGRCIIAHHTFQFPLPLFSAFGLQRSQGTQEREESNQQAPRAPAHPAQGAVHSEFGRVRTASPPGEPRASWVATTTASIWRRSTADQLLLTPSSLYPNLHTQIPK